nr:protein Shroom4 isoform X2 [Geotrypetes seraphini]
MQVGDELVNINGTPLYGSRQEALILIKGSFRILKMIVRRRNVPVIRPHSWHLAKLSEVRTEAAAMHFPSDAFSLSWHSGCEASDLSIQWNQLSRHCSTDKSSSIGSMESLDQPNQTYFEGNLSPIDQSMYHNKRDSAYSSFSASSNTSDYTQSLRPEESASMDCILQGLGGCKHNDGRYLQTGNGGGETPEESNSHHHGGHSEPSSRPSSCTYETNLSGSSKAAPQPPVRRDSLRASKAHAFHSEKRRASAPVDSLHLAGRWTSDTFLSVQNKSLEGHCHCGQAFALCSGHTKDQLTSDQYYMLSSQTDKGQQSTETLLNGNREQSNVSVCKQLTDNSICNNKKSNEDNRDQAVPVSLTDCTSPQHKDRLLEQHSDSECLVSSNLQLLNTSAEFDCSSESQLVQERHQWTVSPLHNTQLNQKSPCLKESDKEHLSDKAAHEEYSNRHLFSEKEIHNSKNTREDACSPKLTGSCEPSHLKNSKDFERSYSVPDEPTDHQQNFQPAPLLSTENIPLRPSCSTETLVEECKDPEENKLNVRKPASSRHRSAQMRKRSDRFATNLRNEIQRRKAQLQKSKGSSILLCGEETVQETDEPCETACPPPSRCLPPPPPPPAPKNWSSCTERRGPDDIGKEISSKYLNQDPKQLRMHETQKTPDHLTDRDSAVSAVERTAPTKVILPSSEGKPSNDIKRVMSLDCLNRELDNHELKAYEPLRSVNHLTVPNTKRNAPQKNRSYIAEDEHSDIWRTKSSESLNQETKNHELRISEARRVTDQLTGRMAAVTDGQWKIPPKCKSPISDRKPPCNMWRTKSSECLNQETKSQDLKVYDARRTIEHSTSRMSIISDSEQSTPCPSPEPEKQRIFQIPNRNGGRWKWSPEHKLQPQFRHPKENQLVSCIEESDVTLIPKQILEESTLLPFADRRKFFEETSKTISNPHHPVMLIKQNKSNLRSGPTEKTTVFQPAILDCRDRRRHSIDQTYHPASPMMQDCAISCSDCLSQSIDQPMCCKQGKHPGDCDYLRAVVYTCNVHGPVRHEPCIYCSGDICPALLKRNLQPSHHSYRCHHHQWPRCAECCCLSQHSVMEESSSICNDHWQARKPFSQELPLEEWEQQTKINRKTSKSVSELPLCKIGFQRVGPFRSCCESADHEWPSCFRTVSSHDLSCDHDRPIRTVEFSAYEDGPEDPQPHPLRGRALSESHINFEPLRREKREPVLEKLEESRPEPAKKKGPPPPRPPPPNWGRFEARRASHHHLYRTVESSGSGLTAQSDSPGAPSLPQQRSGIDMETVRQRSQSLPLEQAHRDILKPVAIPPPRAPCWMPLECSATNTNCHPSEQGHFSSYQQGIRNRVPDPLVIESGNQPNSRPTALQQDKVQAEVIGDVAENTEAERRPSTKDWSIEWQPLQPALPSPALEASEPAQDGTEAEGHRLATSRRQTVRLNSDELMRDVAERDKSLAGVLNPASGLVTAAEVIGDLFSNSSSQLWREQYECDWSTGERPHQNPAPERYEFQPISPPPGGAISPTSCSAYYNTSAGKAELLNKMKGLPEVAEVESDEDVDNELAQRKMQLIESISRKLSVLHEAQRGLLEDIAANSALGDEVEALVKTVCKANEFDKYRMFIGDLDKVVNLLLSLSGRLARVENALNCLDPETAKEEKLALREKKRQLTEQLEDAKELKEHVDRREKVVYDTISRYLMEEQLQDYHHFVKMKSALIIEQRELEEKIKLGEEQLKCLRESLSSPKDY